MGLFNFNLVKNFKRLSQYQKDEYLLFCIQDTDEHSINTIELLIEAGANVNFRKECTGLTPLIAAVTYSSISIVALLIHVGAKLTTTNWNAETALSRALSREFFDKANLLFWMMSEDELIYEMQFNKLRISTYPECFHDISLLLKQMHQEKNRFLANALVPLLPGGQNKNNCFSILPMELKYCILFKYCQVVEKTMLDGCYTEKKIPKQITFSLDVFKQQQNNQPFLKEKKPSKYKQKCIIS